MRTKRPDQQPQKKDVAGFPAGLQRFAMTSDHSALSGTDASLEGLHEKIGDAVKCAVKEQGCLGQCHCNPL